jgi:hypothetical protein
VVKEETQVFQRKYVVVQRAVRPLSGVGISIISEHWFKGQAERKANAMQAQQAQQDQRSLVQSYTWEVDTRCA